MWSITTSLWTAPLSLSLQELSVKITVEAAKCAEVLLLSAHVHMHRKRRKAQCRTSQPRGFVGFALFETSVHLPLRFPVRELIFVNSSVPPSIIHNTHTSRATWRRLRWCVDLILFHQMRPSRGTFSCGSRSSLPHAQSASLSLQLTRCLYVDDDLFFQLSSLMSPVQTRSLIPPGQRTRVIGVAFLLPALLAIFN